MAGNGDFANTNVWFEQNGATLSVSGNVATITGNGSTTQAYIGQTVTGLTVGKQYMITCDAKRGTTVANAAITVNGILSAMTNSTSFVPLHVTFTATATSQLVLCFMNGTGSQSGTALFQNFTFRLAEADRSWKGANIHGGNGLQVFGTVTKTAVATGADLVAYSGFNGNNYLRQPYNADLQFGTGSFSIMGWYKVGTVSSTYRCLVYINSVGVSSVGSTNHGFQLLVDPSEQLYSYIYGPGDAECTTSGVTTDGAWHMFCHVTHNQSSHKLYIDGVERASSTATTGNINNTNAQLMLGAYGGTTAGNAFPFTDGSLANIRISGTAPTPEQIAKMYNDEKHLFATNAKATIYGTSNNPLAIAYDDSTELLHVGTSAGRSEFQGLNRVNNTTDAVSAAISASNGFIVED
jgi:hypothetical protein